MKNNPLNDIVKCTIEISEPVSNDVSFDSILLVVKAPANEGKFPTDKVIMIAQADELKDYGYTVEEPAYIAAQVAFSQSPTPDKLYLVVRRKEEDVYENMKDTLSRASSEVNFYGIHITEFKDKADVEAVIEWTESNKKLFAFEYTDIEACPVTNFSYYRSFGIFSGKAEGYDEVQPDVNKYAGLAWMAKCFGYDPGTETWAMKTLSSIVPSGLSPSEKSDLTDKQINMFLRYSGSNITIGGHCLAGEWIDVIRFRDWLETEVQTNVFNVLKANRKVPFTDAGIGLIEGAIDKALKKGQNLGGIADTEFDSDGNEYAGYTVTVPKATDLSEAERASRKLTGIKWSARLAGAIHAVEIEGFLTF